jgi:hypothetical protein
MLKESFSLENVPPAPENRKETKTLRENIFHEVVATKIVDTYEKELERVGFSEDAINAFREEVVSLSLEDRERLFAYPWELKQRALPMFAEKIKTGKETVALMVQKLVSVSEQQHRKIAFHASKENIFPKVEQVGSVKSPTWVIYGRESDHRDNDLPMAYYSFDYEHLYRTKSPDYIYIVSIQEDESSGHRKDGNNEWGRAPSLSVIEKLDLKEIDKTVDILVAKEKAADTF